MFEDKTLQKVSWVSLEKLQALEIVFIFHKSYLRSAIRGWPWFKHLMNGPAEIEQHLARHQQQGRHVATELRVIYLYRVFHGFGQAKFADGTW